MFAAFKALFQALTTTCEGINEFAKAFKGLGTAVANEVAKEVNSKE